MRSRRGRGEERSPAPDGRADKNCGSVADTALPAGSGTDHYAVRQAAGVKYQGEPPRLMPDEQSGTDRGGENLRAHNERRRCGGSTARRQTRPPTVGRGSRLTARSLKAPARQSPRSAQENERR